MKLNCDMGEGFGPWSMGMDNDVMPYVDMANIACGFHASDPFIMSKTVRLAKSNGVSIGAHPGYPDLLGFGRRDMAFSLDDIADLIVYQLGALQAICHANGTRVDYVKPHGALYHLMMQDSAVRERILQTLASLSAEGEMAPVALMVLANAEAESIRQQAKAYSVPLLFEAFCDRAYDDEGNLVSRQVEGAVLHKQEEIEARICGLIEKKQVISLSGKVIPIMADTICVHGDHEQALASVKKVRHYIQTLTR